MKPEISSGRLARSPLFDACRELRAKMTEFAGWEMPVQFTSIRAEHEAVRIKAGMFDISHMGKFVLQGKEAIASLQALVPSDLSRLKPGQAQYTVLLNDRGGIIDDIIVYDRGQSDRAEQQITLIVNAATKEKDKAWLLANIAGDRAQLQDLSEDKALLAIQGPQAINVLQPLVEADLSPVKRFAHLEAPVFGEPAFIARTGYTGEDGFEIMVAPTAAVQLWQQLLEAGVSPCGLGARDTLRLEAAMALYGQDIDETTTPLEAGLNWLVHLGGKGDFIGRSVLEEQKAKGVSRRLVGLQTQGRHIARHGYRVLFEGEPVGEVTSGTLSPTLGYPVALAYVPKRLAKVGQPLEVEIRGKSYPAIVVKKPFYKAA